MSERIEAFKVDHLEECAEILVATFNAEPWNDSTPSTRDTANPIRLEAVTGPSRSLRKQVRLSPQAVVHVSPSAEEGTSSD